MKKAKTSKKQSTAKKAPEPTVSIKVSTEKDDNLIEWGYWHKPMVESILAFKVHETLDIVRRFNLVHTGVEHEPITADSIIGDLFRLCEKLIELHLSKWTSTKDSRPDSEANIYRDDTGNLVAELDFATADDDPNLFYDPKLSITLYTSSEMGPWFQINFQMVSQFF